MLKFTIELLQGRRSWSEAHYSNLGGTVGSQAANAQAMAAVRAAVLGQNAFVTSIRVSSVPANRQTETYVFLEGGPPVGSEFGVQPDIDSMMANNAPLVTFNGQVLGPPSFPAPTKNYYPGGCYASLFETTGPSGGDLNKNSSGYAPLIAWLNFLSGPLPPPAQQTNWAYRTRNPVGTVQGVGLVQNVANPTQVGVITQTQLVDPTNANAPLVPGQKVYLTGWRRLNPRLPNLEGAFKIAGILTGAGPPATWTYFLYATSQIQIANYAADGVIGPLLYTFAFYNNYNVEKWVTRKRGGSLGAPRGRSLRNR